MAERDLPGIDWEAELSPAEAAEAWQPGDASRLDRWRHRLDRLRLAVGATFEREMEARRGFLWLPVCFGTGILIYFALPAEPMLPAPLLATAVLAAAAWLSRGRTVAFRLLVVLATLLAGIAAMTLRTSLAATPMLSRSVTGTVTGFVERRQARVGGDRLTVRITGFDARYAGPLPRRVTVTVRGATAPFVGDGIRVLAQLRPPSGPAFPGGYDFRRTAFFDGIGATGFAYGKPAVVDLGPPPLDIRLRMPLEALREAIRARIAAFLPGESGKIATSLIIGDAGGLSEATQEAMRQSGLAHILSVSGLHMVLVSGVVFAVVRALLALFPSLALRRPIKKWAAIAALSASAFYLLISGLEVAAQRSFVMTAVLFLAILLDRRALSLRNIAISAWAVLIVAPESLLSASFQMSFAATIALVAGFEALSAHRRRGRRLPESRLALALRRVAVFVGLLATTSMLGGLGSTPFALYHFQRMAPLSILANIVASPLTDLLIMPLSLLAVLAMPFGADGWLLQGLGHAIDGLLAIAATASAWSQGSGGAAMPSLAALLFFVAGFLWLSLWSQTWRLAGLAPMLIGGVLAFFPDRPDLLISADGRQAAVRLGDGRLALLAAKPDGFTTDLWLRADGDPRQLATDKASLMAAQKCDSLGCILPADAVSDRFIAWVADPAAFDEDCRSAFLVVTSLVAPPGCAAHAIVQDSASLRRGGAVALWLAPPTPAPETRQDRQKTAISPANPVAFAIRQPQATTASDLIPLHTTDDEDVAPATSQDAAESVANDAAMEAASTQSGKGAVLRIENAYPSVRRPWMPPLQ